MSWNLNTSHNAILNVTASNRPTTCLYHQCLDYEDYVDFIQDYIKPKWYEWIFICMHLLVFLIGIVGNLLVCVSVYRNRSMRTITNYFIVNLAVADFLVLLICLPPTVLWDITETWFFGSITCKLILYLQNVSVCVSVLTLGAISIDRWYAICNPLKFKGTSGQAKLVIIIIWIISLSISLPHLIWLHTNKEINLEYFVYLTDCRYEWGDIGDYVNQIITVAIFYVIPLTMMSVAYYQIAKVLWTDNIPGLYLPQSPPGCSLTSDSECANKISCKDLSRNNRGNEGQMKTRRKAAKMLIAVVVLFAFCYLPVHLLSVLRSMMSLPQTNATTVISLLSHWLSYFNSAANPIIYTFMSGKFRKEFQRVGSCIFARKCTTKYSGYRARKKYMRGEQNIDMNRFAGFEPRMTLEDNPSPRY